MPRVAAVFSVSGMLERELKKLDRQIDNLLDRRKLVYEELLSMLSDQADLVDQADQAEAD